MPSLPPKPALKYWAPMSFWLQSAAMNLSPGTQRPCHPGSLVYPRLPSFVALPLLSVRSEKERLSGQTPLSTIPMTTPSPLALSALQKPPVPLSPRKPGVLEVSSCLISSLVTATTPGTDLSFCAAAGASRAAKPL